MSILRFSYKTAEKIIDIYADKLGNKQRQPYGYSEMGGYTLMDLITALRISAAFRVFQIDTIEEKMKNEFHNFAEQDDTTYFHYFNRFVPDDVKQKLLELDPTSPDYNLKRFALTPIYTESEEYKEVVKLESAHEFLDFCISIKGEKTYWFQVFKRLNLESDGSYKKDKIKIEENVPIINSTNSSKTESDLNKEIGYNTTIIKSETKTNFNKTYLAKYLGLFFLCFLATYSSNYSNIEDPINYYLLVTDALGNFIVYSIVAYLYYAVTLKWKEKAFSRYFKILTVIVVVIFAFALVSASKNKNTTSVIQTPHINHSNEKVSREVYFKAFNDTCYNRFILIKSKAEAKANCDCLTEKAKLNWTDDDINSGNLRNQKGVGDSIIKWMDTCY